MLYGLPNIDTIKDLISGSFSDKLKAFIEPHALVNAAIFLTLNLALVFPVFVPSLDQNTNPFISSILSLSSSWQIVLAGLALVLISYGINILGIFFLNVASGDVFRNTPFIDRILRWNQERIYERYLNTIRESRDDERNQIAYRFAYQYPVEKSELGLTTLGNLLISPSSYIFHQYGASSELAWPIIQDKLGENDKTTKLVQENWTSLLFLTSLEILLLVICFELILAAGFSGQSISWLKIIVLILGAILCYSISLEKARQWGSSLRRVFDLKINVAFSELGMKALGNLTPADEKFGKIWQDVSTWLAYGAHIKKFGTKKYSPDASWYNAPRGETWPQVKSPEFLQVEFVAPSLQIVYEKSGSLYQFYEAITYMFALTNKGAGEKALPGESSYLVVMDKLDLPLYPASVPGRLLVNSDPGKSQKTIVFEEMNVVGIQDPAANCLALTFPLGDIAAGQSRVLSYYVKKRLLASLVIPSPDPFTAPKLEADRQTGVYTFILNPVKGTGKAVTVKAENFIDFGFREAAWMEYETITGIPDPRLGNRTMTWKFPIRAITDTVMIIFEKEPNHE